MKCHAIENCGVIHTLRPVAWPRDDRRRKLKYAAYADGVFWRFFGTKAEWEVALRCSYSPPVRGPHAQATERAVLWSEFEGRMMLDRLAAE